MQRTATAKFELLQPLNEVFLSLNLALAAFYFALLHHFIGVAYSKDTSDDYAFLYYFLRAAVRLNRLLHYQPYGYEQYARWPNAGGRLSVELAFALTTVFLGVLFLTVFRLVRNSRHYNNVLRYVGGLVFVLAFPLTYVLLFKRGDSSTLASTWSVAIPELFCATVLVVIYLIRPFSAWVMGILLLHYGLWALVYRGSGTGDTLYGPIPPRLLLLLIPIGGAVWLFYCQVSRGDSKIELSDELVSKQLLAAVAVSIVGMGALWLPGGGYSLVHAKSRDSLTIEKWHSNCQMGCPVGFWILRALLADLLLFRSAGLLVVRVSGEESAGRDAQCNQQAGEVAHLLSSVNERWKQASRHIMNTSNGSDHQFHDYCREAWREFGVPEAGVALLP